MHVPDHFLSPEASIITGVIVAGAVTAVMTVDRPRFSASRLAVAGATAALVFGAQMVNFPVLSGTSGHLIGAALAVALVGPRLALIVMTSVLALQAVTFGDGGVTALGTNVLVMGVVPIAVTAGVRVLAHRVGAGRHVLATSAMAALLSVPAGALALVALYAVGGAGSVDLAAMAGSMTGIHLLVGIGELAITAGVLSLVLLIAPGVAEWDTRDRVPAASLRASLVLGASAVGFATVLAAVAATSPDGLESIVMAYNLPVGDAVVTGLPMLSGYGAAAGTNLALVGAIGVLAAGLLAAALSSTMVRRRSA